MSAACTSCHNPRGPALEKRIGEHSHPVGVGIDSLPVRARAGQWSKAGTFAGSPRALRALPLYDKRGRRAHAGGRVGCGSCHDAHRWSASGAASARGNVRELEGGPDDSFLRIADGGASALCVNCHVDKAAVARSKHDVDSEGEQGVCADCHLPHNAVGPALWARDRGEGEGAIESLCTDCHRTDGLAKKKLVGGHSHPVGVRLRKSMKNELLPVYAKNGSRAAAGTMDCATCHDPHRWAPRAAGGGAAEDDGDARSSFLRVAAAPSGELCVTCHRGHRAVQGTDHDLNVTAPEAVNRHGQTPAQSGLCGQCHTPHNAFEPTMLWARYLDDEGGGAAERRCRGCHQREGVAGGKVPVRDGHPATVAAWSTGLRREVYGHAVPDMPVYSRSGKKVRTGAIACSTCHEPHRWSPSASKPGKGANVEGDVGTSFLRNASSEWSLCADCHGADALFRYKYFHGEESRERYPLFH
jgi:predicted CXXCH cytochrome family protein